MYTFNKWVFSQKIRRRSRKTVANSLSLRSSEVKPASSPRESGLPWRVLCPAGWGRRDSVAPKTGAEVTRSSCCHAPGTFWKPFCLEWEEKPRTQQRPRGEEPRCSGHSPDGRHPCRRVWRPRRPSRGGLGQCHTARKRHPAQHSQCPERWGTANAGPCSKPRRFGRLVVQQ